MDGTFACPECGNTVEVRGLSPGRWTRCDFCTRLVEIPYIPRLTDSPPRRVRFRRSRWIIAGWGVLGASLVVLGIVGASRLAAERTRSSRLEAVHRLAESAARQRAAGAFGPALVDLDSALELVRDLGRDGSDSELAELRRARGETARQDAAKILADLTRRGDLFASTGAWLTLRARIARDVDLAPLRDRFEAVFAAALSESLKTTQRGAASALESQSFQQALEGCLRMDRLIKLLPPDAASEWSARLDSIVGTIVQEAGVVVAETADALIEGSRYTEYAPTLVQTATRALRETGYIPPPENVSWRPAWSAAPFRLNLEITEQREGNYHATRNRLARIETRLTLSNQGFPIWQAVSIARSRVPLLEIPPSISNQLVISRDRIPAFEDLLYDDATALLEPHLTATLNELLRRPN